MVGLKSDAVESSEDDVVYQGHFGRISRRTRLWLPLIKAVRIVSLHILYDLHL